MPAEPLNTKHRSLLLSVHAASLWPVWKWYAARMTDGSDEPWGLLALVAALAIVWWGRQPPAVKEDRRWLALGTLLTLLYAAIFPSASALIRAAVAVAALGCTLIAVSGSRARLPIIGLLLLSLPLLSSLQFYLGYPMRVLTAIGASTLLRPFGMTVHRLGTAMEWEDRTVLIDAPCSGVKMLWVGLFLGCLLLAGRGDGSLRHGVKVLAAAVLAVLIGNSLRAAALFIAETHWLAPSHLIHDAIGVASFVLTCGSIAAAATRRSHARF